MDAKTEWKILQELQGMVTWTRQGGRTKSGMKRYPIAAYLAIQRRIRARLQRAEDAE